MYISFLSCFQVARRQDKNAMNSVRKSEVGMCQEGLSFKNLLQRRFLIDENKKYPFYEIKLDSS